MWKIILWAGLLCVLSCSSEPTSDEIEPVLSTYAVSMLIDAPPEIQIWHSNVSIPRGFDAFQLTELVTDGHLTATWYPSMKTHYIESILGLDNSDTAYWMIFLWNESQGDWEPLPVGADWFSLKDGHILAWSYVHSGVDPQPRLNPTKQDPS